MGERRLRNGCKKKVRNRSHPKLGPSWLVAACAIAQWERDIDPIPRARGDRRFQGVLFSTFLVDTASAFLAEEPLGQVFA